MHSAFPSVDEIEGLVGHLEHVRLELVENLVASHAKGYTDQDLQKLALYGAAIESVKASIVFRKKQDAL